jgi:hypothetical protein
MLAKTRIAISTAIILGVAPTALAGRLPSIDIQKVCRASGASPFADSTATLDVCLIDEQAARDILAEDWETLPARDKARCVLPAEYLPSYIEWLTCLEMERDFRKIRQQQPDEQPAPVSLSRGPLAAHAVVSRKRQCFKVQFQAAQTAKNNLTDEAEPLTALRTRRPAPCRG